MFEIRLFGTPSVQLDGQEWKVPRRVTRALLYFLATNPKPVGRDYLSILLWPDATEKQARRNLRDHLGKLKSALPNPSFLITTYQTVALDHSLVTVDFQKFQDWLSADGSPIWASTRKRLPAATYRALVRAVELWRDPGFLAGEPFSISIEFDKWLIQTSRNVESQYLNAVMHLFGHDHALGNHRRALHWLRLALRTDELNEEWHYLLLETLISNNQHVEVRKHFEHLEKLPDEEKEILLSDRTRTLVDRMHVRSSKPAPARAYDWPLHPSLSAPYVGQEQVFAQLETTYRTGGGAVIFGEAGAGKTRLVQEFYNLLHPQPRLLLASCSAQETDLPFYPWVELLRNNMDDAEWRQLPEIWANQLVVLIPELSTWRADLQSLSDANPTRTRHNLFEAIRQALLLMIDGNPAVIFLDDVHWADASSFDLLVYLLEHSIFARPGEILILAARIEEPNPRLAKILQGNPRRQLEQLHLTHLTQAEVADLASYILGNSPPEAFNERLAKDSGGNPFFVLETLQAILNLPIQPPLDALTDLPVPTSMHQLIQNRLRRLSPQSLELLQTAAVLGNRFEANALRNAAGLTDLLVSDTLDELQSAHLITEVQDSIHLEFAFVHDKIRESLLKGITYLRLRTLHKKAARALEHANRNKTDEIAVILAQHYEEAGDFSSALDYWIRAANYAYKLTSVEETLYAFNRAKQLIPIAQQLDDAQIYELYSTWSHVNVNLDDRAEVEFLNRELLEVGHERQSDLLIGAALNGLSDACFVSNRFQAGLELTQQSLPYLERAGHVYELLLAKHHQSVFLYMLGNLPQARLQLYDLFENFPAKRDSNLSNLYGNLHYQIGILESIMGWPATGLDFLQKALNPGKRFLSIAELVSVYAAMGLAHYLAGNYTAGMDTSAKAIEMGAQMVYKRMVGYAYAYHSLNAQEMGWLEVAWQHANQALAIGKNYGHNEITSLAYRSLGDICTRVHDFEGAIQMYSKGVESGGQHFVTLDNDFRLEFIQMLQGIGGSEEHIEQIIATTHQIELGGVEMFARAALTLARMEQDPKRVGINEILRLYEEATIRSLKLPIRLVELMYAIAEKSSNQTNSAIWWLDKVIQESASMANPSLELKALRTLIPILVESNLPADKHRMRLRELVRFMDSQAVNLPINKAWKEFRGKLMAI